MIGCNIRDNLPAINSPSLHKDNANRMQNFHACMKSYAEMQLILSKDNANRMQNFHACMKSYAEMQLILSKDQFYN